MALSRNELLKDLLPGLNDLFGTGYNAHTIEVGKLSIIPTKIGHPALGGKLVQVVSWDGNEWVNVGNPVSKEEAYAIVNVSK